MVKTNKRTKDGEQDCEWIESQLVRMCAQGGSPAPLSSQLASLAK